MNKIIVFSNKKIKEEVYKKNDLLNLAAPFRLLICSPPNGGKTTLIKNIICAQKRHFQVIFICHPAVYASEGFALGGDFLEDYAGIDCVPLDSAELPKYDSKIFNNNYKKLLIFDDVLLNDKNQKNNINKLFSYASSHYNLSLIVSVQDQFSQQNVSIKRFCNGFLLGRFTDGVYNNLLSRISGIDKKKIIEYNKKMGQHNFIFKYKDVEMLV